MKTTTMTRSVLAALLLPVAAAAQQGPPAPLPLAPAEFPEFQERTLSNGARLLVVSNDEVPFVSLNMILQGGSALDPVGMEGLASMTASLIEQGTANRTGEQIAETLDFLGSSVGAGASADYTSVSAGAPLYALDETLEVLADVVMNPSFPDDKLELFRTQTLSALQVAASQAGTVASNTFSRILYGEAHPYGRQQTEASIAALDRASVVDFHSRTFSPASALFVVAGDVEVEDIADRLETVFAGWDPTPVETITYPETPTRAQPEVFLVHKAGSVQAEVRIGHLLMPGNHEDWTAVSVMNQVLGGGASGRLNRILREERGYTYGAGSSASRSRDRGQFTASMAVRNEVTGEAINEMLSLIGGIREEAVPADELEQTKNFLVGSFPLGIETPQQVAGQVTTNRLLGLPEDAIETYGARVSAMTPASIQAIAREHLRPEELVVVVVGDATQIRDQLQGMGNVTLLDERGMSIEMADLLPRGASESFSASNLLPSTSEYQVVFQGNPMGTLNRELREGEVAGTMTFESNSSIAGGAQTISQSVTFRAGDFGFLASTQEVSMQGQTQAMEVAEADGRMVGVMSAPTGEQPIDVELQNGTLVGEMAELVLWIADLSEGKVLELPVANPQFGSIENVIATVAGVEEITVPAGTFQAYRVELTGSTPQTVWVRVEGPHYTLRIQPAGQPVTIDASVLPGG